MLLRAAQVGRVLANRDDYRSDSFMSWVKQNISAARRVIFQQGAGFTPSALAGETIMGSCVIPGGLIAQVEEAVSFYAAGVTAATANNKTINAYLGTLAGTLIYTSGAAASNNKAWEINGEIVRTSAVAVSSYCSGIHNSALVDLKRVSDNTANQNLVADTQLSISAVAPTANSDALQELLVVEAQRSWNITLGQ